ncbi:MAG: asparagine synthase-related protein, partial [Desulfotomaculaceae bacterium]
MRTILKSKKVRKVKGACVAVALSGGVDSSVAAALLKEQGHDVIAVTMQVNGLNDAGEAAAIAGFLGVEHFVVDLRKTFRSEVISYFCSEYLAGLTPNPCVRCNKRIKFGVLLDAALDLGADYLATGHYAQVEYSKERKRYLVQRAADRTKDQTYIMYSLAQNQLSKILLPLGEYTKEDVRALARKMGLPAADRPESQEICFIPSDDYRAFLKENSGVEFKPGPFIDIRGKVIG